VAGETSIVNLRAARRALQDARGKQKLDLLIDAPDPGALVRSLPAEELYFALLEIGPDDAAEIVAMAAPEQFRHFIDMAAWRASDEGPSPRALVHWLRLARISGNDEAYREKLAALDAELLSLLLRRELRVHDLSEEEGVQPANPGMAFYTPDSRFLVEFTGAAELAVMRQLVEDLYERDPFAAGRLLESIRWEVPTEMEESARRWREGRLRDAGVPSLEEAVSFYARPALRPEATLPQSDGQALAAPQRPLLEAALELLEGDELERAEESATYAANAALVASRVRLDDADEVRAQLANARATLSLGLELLSAGDPARAARALVDKPVREIFQAAMGEAYRLQSRARKIAQSARLPQAQSATLLDEPLEGALQALLAQRPAFREPGQRPRAFASRADLARASSLLDDAEATLALLDALGLSPPKVGPLAEEAGLGPAAVKASGVVWAFVESKLRGEPLSLKGVADEVRPKSAGFDQALDESVRGAVQNQSNERVLQYIKSVLSKQ
jgi:hypothetical protein